MDELAKALNEARRVTDTLQTVAKSFAPDSAEAFAIREAIIAYLAVQRDSALKEGYRKLRLSLGARLTDEMKARLKEHGFVPDEADHDEPPHSP